MGELLRSKTPINSLELVRPQDAVRADQYGPGPGHHLEAAIGTNHEAHIQELRVEAVKVSPR